jgi:hypothetical protein
MVWLIWLGAALSLLLIFFSALAAYGHVRWSGLTEALTARLETTRQSPAPSRYDARELDGLPAPVQRYFRAVLRDGAPIVAAATVEHRGTFNIGETTDRWLPFASRQRVVTRPPGFVWDASTSVLPGLAVRVHDAYVAGEGILHPAVLGLFTLADLRGGGEVARGELMRFFAEAAWYPTALLPSQGVRWEAVDGRSARATLTDGPLSLTLTFRFDTAEGLMTSVRAEARGRTLAGRVIPTPWQGRWSNYQPQGGMLVPMTGEVAWLLPEGDKPYWRGTITRLDHEFAP